MTHEELQERVLHYIRQRSGIGSEAGLTIDTDLHEAGHVDSMRMIGLMALLEELGAKDVDCMLSNPGQVRTVRSVVEHCF